MTPSPKPTSRLLRRLRACAAALALLGGGAALADPGLAVVYPDIGQPYRAVFEKIIEGIEDKTGARVNSYAVGGNAEPAEVRALLRRQDARVVIALGRQGSRVVAGLDRGVVIGGVVSPPENDATGLAGIALSPDPGLLFARLKTLMPGVKRVHLVYDPRHTGWLLRFARDAARVQGLELLAQEAADLRGAVRLYQELFASADSRRDAIWLAQDPTTAEEGSILPLVLQESWNRNLVVFSSNFSHVRRGALFSLYPDNVEMGRSLAALALAHLTSGDHAQRGMQPLRDVRMAINVRTARHLGMSFTSQQLRGFDLVFPEP